MPNEILPETAKTVGVVLGAIAFLWRVWDQFTSYLHFGLTVELGEGRYALARATVENTVTCPHLCVHIQS
jgi:hypothetical protein